MKQNLDLWPIKDPQSAPALLLGAQPIQATSLGPIPEQRAGGTGTKRLWNVGASMDATAVPGNLSWVSGKIPRNLSLNDWQDLINGEKGKRQPSPQPSPSKGLALGEAMGKALGVQLRPKGPPEGWAKESGD